MPRTPEEIEASIRIPESIANRFLELADRQDEERGAWPNPRDATQPDPPWPAMDDPAVRFLVHKAEASIAAGMEQTEALLTLAVHAYFEGGIAGYDRGQRDARRPRPVD